MEKGVKKPKGMVNPIGLFFKLGDKVTKGDPKRLVDFQYYMIWLLFLAFFSMFIVNIYNFFRTWDLNNLIFAAVGFAIMSLQFFSLKNLYEARNLMKEQESNTKNSEENEVIEGVDDMLKGFK